MHRTAMMNAELFFKTYMNRQRHARIVEIGSQNVNGSLHEACPQGFEYIGVDFAPGNGVDIVLEDPYELPFDDGEMDCCMTSSVFEHSEMFWLLFLEILRILKPDGLLYLNVPSNGDFHRYPVDCWRFYPDSGTALVNWAKRCGMNPVLLESYISLQQHPECWNDFIAVFLKDSDCQHKYPHRIIDTFKSFYNGRKSDSDDFVNYTQRSEDRAKLELIQKIKEGSLLIKWF